MNQIQDAPGYNSAKQLVELFYRYGHFTRIAGGAVRDALMGIEPHDIDLATTATVEDMEKILSIHGARYQVIPTGIAHGTLTVVDQDSAHSFEVTTLRRDVATDGRFAEVSFDDVTWKEDAERRDFTINAMYYDPIKEELHDYFDGQQAIRDKVLMFVGDPLQRITEDYLRILRLFRFISKTGFSVGNYTETHHAIRLSLDGLKTKVARERITNELLRLMEGEHAEEALSDMNHFRVTHSLFGGPFNVMRAVRMVIDDPDAPNYARLTAALGPEPLASYPISKKHRKFLELWITLEKSQWPRYDYADNASPEASWIASALVPDLPYKISDVPTFPWTGRKILEVNPALRGKQIGDALSLIKNLWIAGGFQDLSADKIRQAVLTS